MNQGNLAENGDVGAIYCPFANGACRLVRCPWIHESTVQACNNIGAFEEISRLLMQDGFIVEGLSIRCGTCGTLNGHGNVPETGEICPKRFCSLRINILTDP
ncbi:MAG: hypothetical protein UW66_C0035G0007 [Candidatus Moranbacteria bacterium GW2011_GWF1_44_4]|nr:MAG: hypothetical protein UW66_C0035G0007 [Candidatus Moranbacteria bacterium GW2011_GWF1_44_4]